MLNIPDAVKALFKADSVFKNFHVHFPNGENADLNNDDIVAESVSFTESICSKEVFQFGLSERSQIEFECVGVQNIYGMTIECAIEIDVESLGAQWISDNAPTGTEAFLEPQVCTYGARTMYRVPYGRFIVESCPRSQGAMKHRRVNAYDATGGNNVKLNSFLTYKFNSHIWQNDFYGFNMLQNIPLLFACNNNDISGLALTETAVSFAKTINMGFNAASWENEGVECSISFENDSGTVTGYTYLSNWGTLRSNKNLLFRVTCDVEMTNVDNVIARLKELNAPENVLNYARGVMTVSYRMNNDDATTEGIFPFENPKDTGYFYAFANDVGSAGVIVNNGIITKIKIATNGTTEEYVIGTVVANQVAHSYELTDADALSFNVFLEPSGVFRYFNTYIESIDVPALISGYAELNAVFRKTNRFGESTDVSISKAHPVDITPAEYSELWWDEYDISGIGSIVVSYKDIDVGQDQTVEYVIGSGGSVYEMLDNNLLKNISISESSLSGQTLDEYIKKMIAEDFAPRLPAVAFTPVTLDAIGLPYLEAGDFLEIDDADGGTVGTYILSRTISGIQVLTDSIESKGGEVMGDGS